MTERPATDYRPSAVSPPGDTLAELLAERGVTQVELARRLHRPVKTVNEIVKGKAAITPDTALQLERALGTPADFWLSREAIYRQWLAREKSNQELSSWIGWLKELPVREMVGAKWIQPSTDKRELVSSCLRFFGVASVDAWRATYERPLAAFRASTKARLDKGAVAAWLRRGETEASHLECAPFDPKALKTALPLIRSLTTERDPAVFLPSLTDILRHVGVAVVLVKAPKGCPACGGSRWLATDKALIQLSLRYRTNDQLWFTVFHEIGHILKHKKNLVFLDDISTDEGDGLEREADHFARTVLIPEEFENRLMALTRRRQTIEHFARSIGISPGIVVGRLQREGRLPWSHLNDLKVRYRWADD